MSARDLKMLIEYWRLLSSTQSLPIAKASRMEAPDNGHSV